ncbi:hypothetical protein [Candidatus Lokiarchaeum ossiferum]|uniref:hypothetical protein n=1 Tax=Candidatus Lokiarchaeum ossiferum TaxID=2951803 RepID=UPI00352DF35A
MGSPKQGIKNLAQYRKKRQLLKAKRLAANKPKWKDEKYMTPEEYEAYVDEFLRNHEKDLELVKIAVSMYGKKQKYASDEKNILDSDE